MGDAGQERVVEVEHAPGGAERGDAIARLARGARGCLIASAFGARRPVEERGTI
jgi:hypothetical protein